MTENQKPAEQAEDQPVRSDDAAPDDVEAVVAGEADAHGETVIAAAADEAGNAGVVAAEADAHGATVVRAATDESGATAVVATDADKRGATVVAAVGDESGVKAVAAMDTDYFNTVLAAEFAHPDAAKAAYFALQDAEIQGVLRIDGVLAVHADEQGKIHIDKLTEHSTKTGVKWGAAAGFVIGALFPPAILASTIGWGVIGGALGKIRNVHHRSQVAQQLEGAIGPNNSGIIALIHGVDVEKVKAQMPDATKVTTAEVDEETAKDIAEEAKKAEGEQPAG
jgi:uncharacterized membrane protein